MKLEELKEVVKVEPKKGVKTYTMLEKEVNAELDERLK